LVLVTGTIR